MIKSRVRVSAIPLILLLSIILLFLHESSASYAGTPGAIVYPSKVKQISWKPRAFVYEGFLTDEECDHLISLAKSELKRSAVADNLSGKSKLSEVRTSSGMFIHKGKDPIVAGIEDKIAAWTFLPKENGEDIQVLKYEHGQKYDPHYDYFADKVNIARGGHRIATVLMYLSDVSKGGETVFPQAEESPRRKPATADDDLSECAKKGTAVKPRRGDALLFFSLIPSATPDPLSLHAGCPVIEGEKWSATKWIHVDSFDKILGDVGGCADENDRCEQWAALGECTKNPEYMVGTANLPGACRRSCKVHARCCWDLTPVRPVVLVYVIAAGEGLSDKLVKMQGRTRQNLGEVTLSGSTLNNWTLSGAQNGASTVVWTELRKWST